jgi:hypothetical protein
MNQFTSDVFRACTHIRLEGPLCSAGSPSHLRNKRSFDLLKAAPRTYFNRMKYKKTPFFPRSRVHRMHFLSEKQKFLLSCTLHAPFW